MRANNLHQQSLVKRRELHARYHSYHVVDLWILAQQRELMLKGRGACKGRVRFWNTVLLAVSFETALMRLGGCKRLKVLFLKGLPADLSMRPRRSGLPIARLTLPTRNRSLSVVWIQRDVRVLLRAVPDYATNCAALAAS